MQEEYTGRLMGDGHLYIPKEIINKLKIDKGSRLRVTIKLEGKAQKEKILSYAGLLSELTEEEKRFDESIKRRSFFSERNVEI